MSDRGDGFGGENLGRLRNIDLFLLNLESSYHLACHLSPSTVVIGCNVNRDGIRSTASPDFRHPLSQLEIKTIAD